MEKVGNDEGITFDESVIAPNVDDEPINETVQPVVNREPGGEAGPTEVNNFTELSNEEAESNVEETFEETQGASKKRKRNKRKKPEEWDKNERKKRRNLGLKYIKTTGKIEPAKKPRTDVCGPHCALQCSKRFNNEDIIAVNRNFWQLGDIEKQRDFICRFVKQEDPLRSRKVNSRRKYTNLYSLSHNGREMPVCQKFFLSTLSISEKKIRVALQKGSRSQNAIPSPDKRGRRTPINKTSEDRIKHMVAHIDSFPRVPAHWCRAGTLRTREFLESFLNREKTYSLYVDHCHATNYEPVCKTTYKEKLIEKNISFHTPKKDRCWCYDYERANEQEKEDRKEEYLLHKKQKDAASLERTNDKQRAIMDKTVLTANFDLQAVLYCPLEFGKPSFYKRKFAVFNFTLYEVAKKKGHCFMWNESQGNRGSNEIATCLRKFILSIPPEVKTLNLFSDCCGGQNRNSILPLMFMYVLNEHPTLEDIFMKFLVPNHTHMECDSMHSTIETAAQSVNIYWPNDWINTVRLAKKGEKYEVNKLETSDFLDFKKMKEEMVMNWSKAEDGTLLNWRQIKCIYFKKSVKDGFFFKNEFFEENFHKIKLNENTGRKRRSSKKFFTNIENVGHPESAYNGPLPIKSAKYQDLQYLCRTGKIPKDYHQFYKNLLVSEKNTAEDCLDEDVELTAMRDKVKTRKGKKN